MARRAAIASSSEMSDRISIRIISAGSGLVNIDDSVVIIRKTIMTRIPRMLAEERKALLVQATLRCLREFGFHGTSIRRICTAAGVSVGLINHHYRSKDQLITETYLHISGSILQELSLHMEQAGDAPRQQLSAFFGASFSPAMLDPSILEAWLAFWGGVRSSPAMREAHQRSYDDYRHTLSRALSALGQQQRWTGFQADRAAIALSAMLDGLWLELSLQPDTFDASEGIRMCESWIDGLEAGAWTNYRSLS